MNFGRYRISDHHTLPNDYSHFMSLSSKTFMSKSVFESDQTLLSKD